LGYDRRISDTLTVGILAAHGDTDGNFDQPGGRIHARNTSIGPYASYEKGSTFADLALWYGDHHFTSSRAIAFSGFLSPLTSTNSGNSTSAYLGGGKMWKRDRWTFGPTASLEWTGLDLHEFTESGGAGALTVFGQNAHSLRLLLGTRIAHEIALHHGRLVPELRLRWAHEFGDNARTIGAQFVGSPTPLAVVTAAPSRDSAYLGFGVSALVRENAHAYVDYDVGTGQRGLQTYTLSGGMRLRF